jgi:hypothetical protein
MRLSHDAAPPMPHYCADRYKLISLPLMQCRIPHASTHIWDTMMRLRHAAAHDIRPQCGIAILDNNAETISLPPCKNSKNKELLCMLLECEENESIYDLRSTVHKIPRTSWYTTCGAVVVWLCPGFSASASCLLLVSMLFSMNSLHNCVKYQHANSHKCTARSAHRCVS